MLNELLSRPMYFNVGVGLLVGIALVGCGEDGAPTAASTDSGEELASAAAGDRWIQRANVPNIERYGHAVAVVPNSRGQSVLYLIGGAQSGNQASGPTRSATTRVQAYNGATNDWIVRASLPIDLYRSNGAGVIDGKIYVSGGRQSGDKRYVNTLFVYDPATNKWNRRAAMPTATWGGTTGVWEGQLYVLTCPSEEDCSRFTNQILYRYDPRSDLWTAISVTPVALGFPKGGFIGGKYYATGGPSGALVAYDPATGEWSTHSPLAGQRSGAAGVTLAGKLYILGGYEGEPGSTVAGRKISVYDPVTDAWSEKALMPTARSDFAAARVVVKGQPRIEAVGGARPGNNLQYIP